MKGTINLDTQVKKIAKVISSFQKLHYSYLCDNKSINLAEKTIENIIKKYLQSFHGQTLQCILPGFPFKFPIRTLYGYSVKPNTIVDCSDYFALLQLEKFIDSINNVYEPGITISILMDSEGFKELEFIPNEVISQYKNELQQMIRRMELENNIVLRDYFDLNPHEYFAQYQKRKIPALDIHLKNIRQANERDYLNRYIGLTEYHRKQLHVLRSNQDSDLSIMLQKRKKNLDNKFKKTVKEAVYHHIWHQDTWRHIITDFFPSHIRLTIHPQKPDSDKIGLYLSDKSNIFAPVPWQGVPLRIIFSHSFQKNTVIDKNVLMHLTTKIPLQKVYCSRIKCSLPCYVIDNADLTKKSEVNMYKNIMQNMYLERSKGLCSFKE